MLAVVFFSEYSLMLLVASKVWGSVGLRVSVASESDTLNKAVNSLWKLDKMHGQAMDKISLTQHTTSHLIMSYIL